MMLRPTGDDNDDDYEDDGGRNKTSSSPYADTSFYLVSGTLETKKNKIQNVITCGSTSHSTN
jgi:hypothetical protein